MAPRLALEAAPVRRGDALWTWDGSISQLALGRFPVRMVVAGYKLPQQDRLGLVVVSPLEPTDEVVAWLQDTGNVNFVVAPNKAHWWWAAAMKAAFPGSLLVAPVALALKRPELPVDVKVTAAGVQDLPGSWPAATIDVISVQGLSFLSELALLHKPSSTLVLTDTAFNFDEQWAAGAGGRLGAGVRLYLRLAGGRRRCCFTRPFRYLIDDAAALKTSLDHILAAWEFDQVSMAHGQFMSENGKDAFVEGTCAFVNDLVKEKQRGAAGDGGGPVGAGVATAAAVLAAAAVIGAGVSVGVAGILAERGR